MRLCEPMSVRLAEHGCPAEILADAGKMDAGRKNLGGERLDMFFMSGSQAQTFVSAVETMTERIRRLGPNPLKARLEPVSAGQVFAEPEEEAGFRGRRARLHIRTVRPAGVRPGRRRAAV